MITINPPASELRHQWRHQILRHCDSRSVAARKGYVALTFADRATSSSTLVDIGRLSAVLVYEDDSKRYDRAPLRLGCYQASRVPHGVQWGGGDNCRLFKDLTLVPKRGARGLRLDDRKHDLIALALKLNRRLSRAAHHPAVPWPGLRLPQLWAGYRARHINDLYGDGPEFERACRRQPITHTEIFRDTARPVEGLIAFPLEWVSHQLDSAMAVFAALTPTVRRQVCRVGNPTAGLVGFQGASAFDFYNSRFRTSSGRRRPPRRGQRATFPTRWQEAADTRAMELEGCVA